MNILEESINELKFKLRLNANLTSEEWNEYAKKKVLFSTMTIQTHLNVKNFDELKKKLAHSLSEKSLNKEIEKTRKRLYKSIDKSGINSLETRNISNEIDVLINTYYKNNRSKTKGRYYREECFMNEIYNKSYEHLKSLTIDINEFPLIKIWNEYALRNNCLSSQSMQYISGFNWNKLRDKIKTSINLESYKKN